MSFKKISSVIKDTMNGFNEAKVLRLSAALAYYAMFSIGPLLVIAVGLAGIAFESESVTNKIHAQLQSTLGESSANTIQSMMTARDSGKSLITTIVGIAALLFGAGGVFGQLQDALNTIWGVKPKPGKGLRGLIRARFLSLAMVLGTGFLLLVSMILTTFLAAVSDSLGSRLPISAAVVHILNLVVSFGVITVLFAMIFKLLPDIELPIRFVWVGAIGTALLFTAGKYILALYLGRQSTASPYGAAGAVIVILLWVYYASVILFLGAEFTRAYAKVLGVKVVPSQYAETVSQEARAAEGLPDKSSSPVHDHDRPRRPARKPASAMLITAQPLGFLGLMAAAGFAGGLLLTLKSARKTVQVLTTLAKGAAKADSFLRKHSR
jgi:membrane protein